MNLDTALAWIRAKGTEFAAAGPRILDGMHRAAVHTAGLPSGSQERADARKVVERWGELLRSHQTALNRWNAIAPRIPGVGGLGIVPVIPLALAAAVIAVAVSMAMILGRVTAEERALKLLEAGKVTPAQAIELAANLEGAAPPRALFGLPLWIPAAAGAAWFFFGRARR